jgi:uncharacterized membrane protein YeaQ/YmgE (transglycosylase-associated protein family)
MTIEALLIIVIVGAIAGWLASKVVRGMGFGLVGNAIVGIIGAFLGTWLFGALGLSFFAPIVNAIITATIGAIILLLVIRVLKRA